MRTGRIPGASVAGLAAVQIVALAASLLGSPPPRAAAKTSALTAARNQYQRAQEFEAALEAESGATRTEAGYIKVITAYRKVERISPTTQIAAPSLLAAGRLYEEMGHLFDTAYFQKAADTYQYLLRRYPSSRLGPEALYYLAELERVEMGHTALAKRSLQSIISKYPSSDQADRARLELADAGLWTRKAAAAAAASSSAARATQPAESKPSTARREAVSTVGNASKLMVSHVEGGKEGSHPTRVRTVVCEQIGEKTQVVVYLTGPVHYRSARISHPERVYFDLSRAYLVNAHGQKLALHTPFVNSVDIAQNRPRVVRVVLDINQNAGYAASLLPNPYRLVIEVGRQGSANTASANRGSEKEARAAAARGTLSSSGREMLTKGNVTPAKPTHSGATSLTRALGLKIDRIVIDPGHGGFDTGTIGPTGVEEKTVCLDIARRLGRLIKQQLPETQVIYTRDSDKFIPLEERTEIANKAKADLFISIHANSSSDRQARGIETYYLNFTTSHEAMAVAARENALAQEPVHQLQDLLKKISLNDKVEESQELALDVDHSLYHELRLGHVRTEDRGVKKAPFVVLIGAHMPSILAEVSFLSNPTGERLMKEEKYRQRVALGLFDGIKRYLTSLNSLSDTEAKASQTKDR